MSIGNSELIYNADGSIYHLNLKREDIGNNIILVGDPDRVPMVSKYFDKITFKISKREFVTHTGYVGNEMISVISSGIGTDNIDIVINELDALVNIDPITRAIRSQITPLKFIRIGTSGTLDPNIPIDSFVATKMAIGMDILMHYYDYKSNPTEKELQQKLISAFPKLHPTVFSGDIGLLEKFASNMRHGITVTAPGFYAPQGRQLRAINSYQSLLEQFSSIEQDNYKVTNFEMESSGIYGLSKCLGHQALSLNAILANRANKTFSKSPKKVVTRLIEHVIDIIRKNDF